MKQKCCRNCKFAKFHLTKGGNIKTSRCGVCLFAPVKPKFPYACPEYIKSIWPPTNNAIWAGKKYGNTCECYEEKV